MRRSRAETIGHVWRERYQYDPETGAITHRTKRTSAVAGARAEKRTPNGYMTVSVQVDGQKYTVQSSRLAWFLQTGEWPSGVIDHINKARDDNRLLNLRDTNQGHNSSRNARSDRTHQLPPGVFFHAGNKTNPYRSAIRVDGVTYYLGYYPTVDMALKVRRAVFKEFHGVYPEE